MCFSASASFGTAALLSFFGAAALRKIKNKRALAIALIPILFGIQQAAEGFVWLATQGVVSEFIGMLGAYIFLFFAFVIWPLWVPLGSIIYEGIKRPFGIAVVCMAAIGVGIAVVGSYALATQTIFVQADCCHIIYHGLSDMLHFEFGVWIYLLVTTGPMILSKKKSIQLLGLAIMIAFLISAWVWTAAFTSVWCYWAAVISGYIVLICKSL
jgi:hypothetical protein